MYIDEKNKQINYGHLPFLNGYTNGLMGVNIFASYLYIAQPNPYTFGRKMMKKKEIEGQESDGCRQIIGKDKQKVIFL